MQRLIFIALTVLLASSSVAADKPVPEDRKTLYAIGLSVAQSLSVFDLTPAELEIVKLGIIDGVSGKKPEAELLSYNDKIQEFAQKRRKALGEKQAGAGKEFLERAAREKGAIKTASGMVYVSLVEGKGESPKYSDILKANYRGTLIDGREFDSSYKRGKPMEFKLDNVIKCWAEGLQKMKPGGKARLVCPPDLAYGDKGAGELVLPGATLAFEVELLEMKPAGAAMPVNTVVLPAVPAKK